MSVEVNVKGLLGRFQHEVAICAAVEVPGDDSGNTWGEAPLQILANQADGLSASHAGPQNTYPPVNAEHDVLHLETCHAAFAHRLESAIYERVKPGRP